jgi:hypothetical protein
MYMEFIYSCNYNYILLQKLLPVSQGLTRGMPPNRRRFKFKLEAESKPTSCKNIVRCNIVIRNRI